MKCRYCDSPEELIWPQPYKKGDKPIRELDGKPHICQNKKPQEISASQTKPISQNSDSQKCEKPDWGEMKKVPNAFGGFDLVRENVFQCPKCPSGSGIKNKKDPDFKEWLDIHNQTLHPFGNDFSWIKDGKSETETSPVV